MSALADMPKGFPADRLALVHGASRWTFDELDACADAWGRTLVARGVRPDDLIAFALQPTPVRDDAGKFRKSPTKAAP